MLIHSSLSRQVASSAIIILVRAEKGEEKEQDDELRSPPTMYPHTQTSLEPALSLASETLSTSPGVSTGPVPEDDPFQARLSSFHTLEVSTLTLQSKSDTDRALGISSDTVRLRHIISPAFSTMECTV